MFLVNDGPSGIERKVRELFSKNPSVGLVIAAVYFEWSLCRAMIRLSHAPNKELRARIQKAHGLKAYRKLWVREVSSVTLQAIVRSWDDLQKAFEARNILVHGRDRYTRNMASPHLECLFASAAAIWQYCEDSGQSLSNRLPVRRKSSDPAASRRLQPPAASANMSRRG